MAVIKTYTWIKNFPHFNIFLYFTFWYYIHIRSGIPSDFILQHCKLFETIIRLFFPQFRQTSLNILKPIFTVDAGRFSNKLYYVVPQKAFKTLIWISERIGGIFLFKCNSVW